MAKFKAKAPLGRRTPKRFREFGNAARMRQLLECGSPAAAF